MDLSIAKHAFVTGGASGLGLGIVDAMRQRGIHVTIADIDTERLAQVLAERSRNESQPAGKGNVQGFTLDTRDRAAWQRVKEQAQAQFGPVDILINNAGIAPNGRPFADMNPESFDQIIAINLTGIANGVFTFAADMRFRGKGHIVNTSSQAGLTASVPGVGAYAVAKHGVVALSEALRLEMEPHGVGVSVLCPGYVSTNLGETTRKLGGDMRAQSVTMPPSKITSEHVAEMVMTGIADNAPYIITHDKVWRTLEPRIDALRSACALREELA